MAEQANLRVIGHELPSRTGSELAGLHIGVQRGTEILELTAAEAESVSFDIRVEPIVEGGVLVDFRGPYVQGKRGARFVYLTWVDVADDGTQTRYGRAKVGLEELPDDVAAALIADAPVAVEMGLTDPRGRPRCASIKPAELRWSRL